MNNDRSVLLNTYDMENVVDGHKAWKKDRTISTQCGYECNSDTLHRLKQLNGIVWAKGPDACAHSHFLKCYRQGTNMRCMHRMERTIVCLFFYIHLTKLCIVYSWAFQSIVRSLSISLKHALILTCLKIQMHTLHKKGVHYIQQITWQQFSRWKFPNGISHFHSCTTMFEMISFRPKIAINLWAMLMELIEGQSL